MPVEPVDLTAIIESMREDLARVLEEKEFNRQLRAPQAPSPETGR